MTISRKLFVGRVTLPADTPTSLLGLMSASSLHWGYETTALTTPSMDSITGSEAGVVPDAAVYVGSDINVNATTGVPLAAEENFSLQDFGADYGVIDPNQIWFFSADETDMSVTFQAR